MRYETRIRAACAPTSGPKRSSRGPRTGKRLATDGRPGAVYTDRSPAPFRAGRRAATPGRRTAGAPGDIVQQIVVILPAARARIRTGPAWPARHRSVLPGNQAHACTSPSTLIAVTSRGCRPPPRSAPSRRRRRQPARTRPARSPPPLAGLRRHPHACRETRPSTKALLRWWITAGGRLAPRRHRAHPQCVLVSGSPRTVISAGGALVPAVRAVLPGTSKSGWPTVRGPITRSQRRSRRDLEALLAGIIVARSSRSPSFRDGAGTQSMHRHWHFRGRGNQALPARPRAGSCVPET
jgi:hypothetical protein